MNINVQPQTEIQAANSVASANLIIDQDQENASQPDYTSMKFAILEIADPVPFEKIKKFYGKK